MQNNILFEGRPGLVMYILTLFVTYRVTQEYVEGNRGMWLWKTREFHDCSAITAIKHSKGVFNSYAKIYFKHKTMPIKVVCSEDEFDHMKCIFL